MTRKESRQRNREISVYVAAGGTDSDARRRFDVSISTVRRACEEAGVLQSRVNLGTIQCRREIAAFIAAGNTRSDACCKFGVSEPTVQKACREAGVRLSRSPLGTVRVYEIIAALQRSDQSSAIARQFNVSPQAVDQTRSKALEAGIVGIQKRKA